MSTSTLPLHLFNSMVSLTGNDGIAVATRKQEVQINNKKREWVQCGWSDNYIWYINTYCFVITLRLLIININPHLFSFLLWTLIFLTSYFDLFYHMNVSSRVTDHRRSFCGILSPAVGTLLLLLHDCPTVWQRLSAAMPSCATLACERIAAMHLHSSCLFTFSACMVSCHRNRKQEVANSS